MSLIEFGIVIVIVLIAVIGFFVAIRERYELPQNLMIVIGIVIMCFTGLLVIARQAPAIFPFFGNEIYNVTIDLSDVEFGVNAEVNVLLVSASASAGTDGLHGIELTLRQGVTIPLLIGSLELATYQTFDLASFNIPGYSSLLLLALDDKFCMYDLSDQSFDIQFEDNQWFAGDIQYEGKNILVSVNSVETSHIVVECPIATSTPEGPSH